jgi:hypothetical protein
MGHVRPWDADGWAHRHWHPGDGRIPCRTDFDFLAALPDPPRLILEVNADLSCLPDTVARLNTLALARCARVRCSIGQPVTPGQIGQPRIG